MKSFELIYEYDSAMQTRKWIDEIPFIKFPADWEVKIIPPFAGATVRFNVKKNDKVVSIYLDCYDQLGCYGSPYWEIYPYKDDTFRCGIKETNELLQAIQETLEQKD